MKLKYTEVTPYYAQLICDCGKELKETSHNYLTTPIQHKYDCECGKSITISTNYPRVVFKDRIITTRPVSGQIDPTKIITVEQAPIHIFEEEIK